MSSLERDGIIFAYREEGSGMPFVFQHGLGGDAAQTFAFVPPPTGVRMVTLECPGHGEARPLGELPLERVFSLSSSLRR